MTLCPISQAARIHRVNRSRLDLAIRRGLLATHGKHSDGAPLVESSEVAAYVGSRWARTDHRHDDLWAQAVCRKPGMDPEMWFPDDSDVETQNEAIRLCHQCPLAIHCLEMAMDFEKPGYKMRAGIFGGTTPQQRCHMEISRKEKK
ncbi:WhiB family transcriptional regulator [Cutibacterium granulosum]|uniref:WhiB family transcriptional regulator n=1 Tax=Cutibacterium granulosum TaxID=33011 RepID=UPI0023F62E92|nr:WhiB family transcriptional regulator [Cutibacterium granulosum]